MAGNENNYHIILSSLKEKIRLARQKAAIAVNHELLMVYWEIGNTILQQQKEEGWGKKVINRLAADLKTEFADMKGLSERNLVYMQTFAGAWPYFPFTQAPPAQLETAENQKTAITQAPLAQLTWYHHTTLLDKLKDSNTRQFYIQKAIENGWSRDVMVHQIETGLHKRQGALTNNFSLTLPAYDSELAVQLFKDPYKLDFIMLAEEAKERDLENALMTHITKLLLELGDGFAFVGRQKKFEAGGKEFFVDLLFYNIKLRRYIVIDLKIGDFLPEYVSKMNVYLGLVDDTLNGEFDLPSIGLILCKTKNKIVAEYALRDTSKPIGIAEYKIAQTLPDDIKGELPSIEDIEQKLDEELKEKPNPVDARLQAIKEKLRGINTDEIQTPASYKILQDLFTNGLKPLYQKLIDKLFKEFKEEFVSQSLYWTCNRQIVYGIEEVQAFWEKEENLKATRELDFTYQLHGFKKGGANDFGETQTLRFEWREYWWGFTLVNHNKQQPFIKKLYHQPITSEDQQLVTDLMMTKVMDRIEWILEFMKEKDKNMDN